MNSAGKTHILVLDDEKDIIHSLQIILEFSGYQVSSFLSPLQALDFFSQNFANVHLVLTDLTMPEMNGREFSRMVKKIKKDIPIIILSGYTEENMTELKEEILIFDFLAKPVEIDVLLAAVASAIGSSSEL